MIRSLVLLSVAMREPLSASSCGKAVAGGSLGPILPTVGEPPSTPTGSPGEALIRSVVLVVAWVPGVG